MGRQDRRPRQGATAPRDRERQLIVEIILEPTGIATPDRYRAVRGTEVLVRSSRQPFLDAARALLAQNHRTDTLLIARHKGSETIAMRGLIGALAGVAIEERDRGGLIKRRWRPFGGVSADPSTEEEAA